VKKPYRVGDNRHAALWAAINEVVRASGGSDRTTKPARQKAVAKVEHALEALAERDFSGVGNAEYVEDPLEPFALVADRLDNAIAALSLPIPPALHVKALSGLLPSIAAELRAALALAAEGKEENRER